VNGASRGSVRGEQIRSCIAAEPRAPIECIGNRRTDVLEADSSVQKQRDRRFIRCIEDRGRGAAGSSRLNAE
jgi:hypothetical protein